MKYDRFRVWLKCMIGEKQTANAIWKLFTTTVGYISFIYTFAILIKEWIGIDIFENICKTHWLGLIVVGTIAAVVHNREKITLSCANSNKSLIIKVTVNDLFAVKASSFVIPTNTRFETNMTNDLISPKSVQGAFQMLYFKNNWRALHDKLIKRLRRGEIQYPIGTVAKINHNKKHYYFLAVCDINNSGRTINQGIDNVKTSLKGLIKFILDRGYCDTLAMPLIGTGRAAIQEATIEGVLEMTIDSFFGSGKRVVNTLFICISPRDYLEGRVDMKRIEQIINYKSGLA